MKKGILIGRLGQDPRVRQTNSGEAVMNLNLAVRDRQKRDGAWTEETQWWDVTVFGKRAEALAKILTKGQTIAAEGDIGLRQYVGRDGTHKAQLELIARDVEPLSPGRSAEERTQHRDTRAAPQHGTRPGTFAHEPPPFGDEDDVPF